MHTYFLLRFFLVKPAFHKGSLKSPQLFHQLHLQYRLEYSKLTKHFGKNQPFLKKRLYLNWFLDFLHHNASRIIDVKHFKSPTNFILKPQNFFYDRVYYKWCYLTMIVYLSAPTRSRASISSMNPMVPELSRSRVLTWQTIQYI